MNGYRKLVQRSGASFRFVINACTAPAGQSECGYGSVVTFSSYAFGAGLERAGLTSSICSRLAKIAITLPRVEAQSYLKSHWVMRRCNKSSRLNTSGRIVFLRPQASKQSIAISLRGAPRTRAPLVNNSARSLISGSPQRFGELWFPSNCCCPHQSRPVTVPLSNGLPPIKRPDLGARAMTFPASSLTSAPSFSNAVR